MKQFRQRLTVGEISRRLGTTATIRFETALDNVAELHEANERSICFLESPAYIEKAKTSLPGLLIVPAETDIDGFPRHNLLPVPQPYVAFMLLVRGWLATEDSHLPHSVHPTAIVHESARLGDNVHVGPYAVIGANCAVGENTVIGPHCVLQCNVTIGKDCRLIARVTLYDDTELGERVIVHAGAVLGADGFGYLFHDGRQEKIPQVGRVVVGNDVEIGAGSCIDRATLGITHIADGVKIDNLVQVGHNCNVGKHTVLCAQVGLAGGTNIGKRCYLAGQVGTGGHLTIGDDVLVGGQSGVSGDIPSGAKYFGSPALEANHTKRMFMSLKQLPDILKPLKKLIKEQNKR
ncbi:MAG: UDP-3-O-(3-hydroxymyristoyl)glucosamine N-acyltransferase [Candidatus Cloacimonetes bacterium]|nr:UDP-3-O-(3-hydroxymyristoyl)glucosamine N-acyltransferase [Candidatus Cloacimonadota bacterium]